MSQVSILKNAIRLTSDTGVTAFLWGHRGVGKSSIVAQVCAEEDWGLIDLRASQMEASDLRGLPDRQDGRTVYLPPSELPTGDISDEDWHATIKRMTKDEGKDVANRWAIVNQGRRERGILFLDELNRAADDVLQAAFQLVLDRRIGHYVLPAGWSIVVAGNYQSGSYQTNNFSDPAFIDRFVHLTFQSGSSTIEDWVAYMANRHGQSASEVIEYATQNPNNLHGEVDGHQTITVTPSPRSWEQVVYLYECYSNNTSRYGEKALMACVQGLVGYEHANAFTQHKCPVKPMMLIKDGVEKHTKPLNTLNRNQMIGLMWGLTATIKDSINASENNQTVAIDFSKYLLKDHSGRELRDLVVAFLKGILHNDGSEEGIKSAIVSNPKITAILAKAAADRRSKSKSGKDQAKTFVERLHEDPDLGEALKKATWGNG